MKRSWVPSKEGDDMHVEVSMAADVSTVCLCLQSFLSGPKPDMWIIDFAEVCSSPLPPF